MLEKLSKNLFVFYSPNIGSNVYVLCGKQVALIDTSIGANEKLLLDSLMDIKIDPKEVSLILFTHVHIDHIGCTHLFKNAEKRMHKADAEAIELQDSHYTLGNVTGQINFFEINNYLKDGEIIKLEPFSLLVIHTPGHTKGSVCFYDQHNKLLFSGDTLFAGACGRTDLPGGDEKKLINSISKLQELDFKLLLPGHGKILDENQKENISFILKTLKSRYL
ncbi:MAG: MBL fold metallo-hydrolase [Candidatus Diapherotrites archaeon]